MVSSLVMRAGEEQKIAGPRKRCNPAFIPRTFAWDFRERAYLMAWGGGGKPLAAGRGAGRQPGGLVTNGPPEPKDLIDGNEPHAL